MFDKVLIANRGAIACRIVRTLNTLGVSSVAVYADSDSDSLHLRLATEAHSLGAGAAADTYLDMRKLLKIARQSGAQAIHPGYGFLSENALFVSECDAAGIAFIGPRPEHLELFGLKHTARKIATEVGVPLVPGTDLLTDVEAAVDAARSIGYPVMLKATAGGGGIGMQCCEGEAALREAFGSVKRLGDKNFSNDGVFLEKFVRNARHIEVQIFGDGVGNAIAIGERDCSSQRRNQKVVEECPAPNLDDGLRTRLHETAAALLAHVNYRNAGTVEFIVDADSHAYYFLEVNTRLQVEHGVTEQVYGIDLVEWMLKLAAGELTPLAQLAADLCPTGHSVQTRIYAEDPWQDFRPCPGLLSYVSFPSMPGVRIDHWVESGTEVSPAFDPMLAKVIAYGESRVAALLKLEEALAQTEIYGCTTNLEYLRALLKDDCVLAGKVTTRYLADFKHVPARIDVLHGGTLTTIQDVPGRAGYWSVGVPPSGAFDGFSFRLANLVLGNPESAAALEITIQGPTLRFSIETTVVLAGAEIDAHVDGKAVPMYAAITIPADSVLTLGNVSAFGVRSYLAVAGGIRCPGYLGSASTFTLGQFGGHSGRALRVGDVLNVDRSAAERIRPTTLAPELLPRFSEETVLHVIEGPHSAPDFFTDDYMQRFFDAHWEVHYNSSRTGIRLVGPKPDWARASGGEAGMHPSNIHDNAYAFGTVDFTGDMPVILGPDGPSLGGFVCPATVISSDLWKLGQLRAGDRVRFVPVSLATARVLSERQRQREHGIVPPELVVATERRDPVIDRIPHTKTNDDISFRVAGDHFLLVEYGPLKLDIQLRFRVHALMHWLEQQAVCGVVELTPGIRSLQVHYCPEDIALNDLIDTIRCGEAYLSERLQHLSVPSRTVHLPLSWDDSACQEAIDKYMKSVRRDAPWCPSNLEFIRRINGLESIDAVKKIVFDAAYLVMGLGDVYLGAPVATPVDPRHRLVTTKYNPARTWTAENSVGIGGSYLCVYGMEGPGGYQFVGRTLQMWNRYRQTTEFEQPWLLRFFDQIRFYEVSESELAQIRRDFPLGLYPLQIEEGEFSLAEYQSFIDTEKASIEVFTQNRERAFETELQRWHKTGQFNYTEAAAEQPDEAAAWPADAIVIDSPVSGNVWQLSIELGQQVDVGETLLILESMKMEIPVRAHCPGRVSQLLCKAGTAVTAGRALVVLEPLT